MAPLGRMLIIVGIVIIVLGVILTFANKLPYLGRLPGDIYIRKKNLTFYFPLATSIIVSILLTLVFYFIKRFK